MPSLDYRAARQLLPLADVLALLEFQRRGGWGAEVRGPCPVHGSHSHTSRSFAAIYARTCGIAAAAVPAATLSTCGPQ